MAIAIDTTSTSTSGSWSHTCTGGSNMILIVALRGNASGASMTCTYNGVSMTKLSTRSYNAGNFFLCTFYLMSPDTGTHTITATTGSPDYGCAISYTGVSDIDSTGNFAINQNGTTASGTVTTGVANARAIMTVGQGGGTTQTAGASTTKQVASTTNEINAIFDPNANTVSPGVVTLVSTFTSGVNAWQTFSLKPSVVYTETVADSSTLTGVTKWGNKMSESITIITVIFQTVADSLGMTDVIKKFSKLWKNQVKNVTSWVNQNKS